MYLLTVTAFYANVFFKMGMFSTTTETFPTKEQCEAAKTQVVYQIQQTATVELDNIKGTCTYLGEGK